MPVLQAQGIGSGLDVAGLVNQLVAAERDPVVKRLDSQQLLINGQISAWGQVTSALSALQTALTDLKSASAFQQRSTTSSDAAVATATADTTVALGNYSLNVTQLAKADQWTATTTGITDTNSTVVGTGSLEISLGGGAATTVTISGTGTLADIRDSINNQVTGVTATIISDGTNYFLSLSSDNTGTTNSITVTATGDGDGTPGDLSGLSQFATANGGMTHTSTAQDAQFDLNGVTGITSSSNTNTSAVSGLTLNLLAVGTSTINVGADSAAAKTSITNFVDAYNKVIKTINTVSKYTEGASSQGPLLSDSMVRNLKSRLQTLVGDVSSNTGAYKTLTALGYATDTTDGTLTLKDSSALDSALSSNFNDVGLLVSDITTNVDTYIGNYLGTTGMIQDRTDSLNTQLDDIQTQRDRLDARITSLKDRYTRQFSALDGLISKMNSTMNYLQQQLAKLPG